MPDMTVPDSYQHQADATLSQANPVSTTLYTLLAAAKNARIVTASCKTTGGTVSGLEMVVTIDDQTIIFSVANPTSGVDYFPVFEPTLVPANQALTVAASDTTKYKAFLFEGRSVLIQLRVTWTVQPTPLEGRIKYAKR